MSHRRYTGVIDDAALRAGRVWTAAPGTGSALALFKKQLVPGFLSASPGFSAGVMIYVSESGKKRLIWHDPVRYTGTSRKGTRKIK